MLKYEKYKTVISFYCHSPPLFFIFKRTRSFHNLCHCIILTEYSSNMFWLWYDSMLTISVVFVLWGVSFHAVMHLLSNDDEIRSNIEIREKGESKAYYIWWRLWCVSSQRFWKAHTTYRISCAVRVQGERKRGGIPRTHIT